MDQLSLEGLKRKRDILLGAGSARSDDDESTPNKRTKSESPPPPPPPPAPMNGVYPADDSPPTERTDASLDTPQTDPVDVVQVSSVAPLSIGHPIHKSPDNADCEMVEGDEAVNGSTHGHPDGLQV